MTETVSPELYLRLFAERALLDGMGGGPRGGPVQAVASAFVAAGVIDAELAKPIVADYALAASLRGRGAPMHHLGTPRSPAGRVLTVPRVVGCSSELSLPWGTLTVHYVILGDRATTVGVTMNSPGTSPRMGPGHPPQVQIADDTGKSLSAGFSGGGQPGGWRGVLTTPDALSRNTRWLEFDKCRLELPAEQGQPVEVFLEDLPPRPPALAHLWQCLATGARPGPHYDIGQVLEALIAVGALDESMPEVDEVRRIAQAVHAHRPGSAGTGPLPEPWRSLVARRGSGTMNGPVGVVAIGAVTPSIDGIQVLLEALMSERETFRLEVATSPGVNFGWMHGDVDTPMIAWWVEDDRGGVYLGSPSSWSGGPDHSRGTIQFSGSLDPRAREVRIMPAGTTQRAVARVPLAWVTPS